MRLAAVVTICALVAILAAEYHARHHPPPAVVGDAPTTTVVTEDAIYVIGYRVIRGKKQSYMERHPL